MKKIFYLLMAYSLLLTAFTGCNNDDDKPVAEIDKLPPATQTGAIGGLFVDNDFFGVGLLGLVPGNSRLNVESHKKRVMGKFNAFEEIITQQKDMKKSMLSKRRIFFS